MHSRSGSVTVKEKPAPIKGRAYYVAYLSYALFHGVTATTADIISTCLSFCWMVNGVDLHIFFMVVTARCVRIFTVR